MNAATPLAGRVAVVTGASSGIGEASAERLAALGARVVVVARRAERLDDLVVRIGKAGGQASALAADVTDAAAARAAAERVAAELGAKNVRVSAIEPGIVGTELQSHVTDEGARAWLEGSKETMEWLTPQDVAQTVGFIASLPPRANLQQVTIMPTGQPS